ncbi:MAG: dihydroneopterin aldolase [Candidatus Hydrogenedentes bacterium]|nr:dihydroneopterin aldolase [Candidatus Hydrogenedentota bacterium]
MSTADATSAGTCTVDRRLDRIHIRDLTCRCIVGINPEERVNKQDVIVNVTLEADLHGACASDAIDDTVDYKRVKQAIVHLVETSQFLLIERLAQAIADACLREPRVRAAHVSVDKPGALRFARSVAVEIARYRDGA